MIRSECVTCTLATRRGQTKHLVFHLQGITRLVAKYPHRWAHLPVSASSGGREKFVSLPGSLRPKAADLCPLSSFPALRLATLKDKLG